MELNELLTSSNTNWTVSKRPLLGPNGEQTPGFGIFRDDNDDCLGIVGKQYTITQNHEIASMMMEAADTLNISATRGGHLSGGKRVFYQFQLPNVQIGNSGTMRYLTGLTAHDGLSKIGFGATNVVIVCQNTFFKALGQCDTVKHTTRHKSKLEGIISTLKMSLEVELKMVENLITLSNTTVPTTITDEFLAGILGGTPSSTVTSNKIVSLKEAINTEFNIHGETAWALFNGVTRYTNHIINYDDIDSKRKSIMFGTAGQINRRAYENIILDFVPELIVNDTMPEFVDNQVL